MRLYSPFVFCLAAALAPCAFVLSSPGMWTKLILTHHWPTTFCHMEGCHSRINYWTVHGLWPDKGIDCNSSWHFNSSLIEDLIPDLEKSWPDLMNHSSVGFWKYEWNKHGTCAAEVDEFNSQHKYFSKTLELYHKLDLDSILQKFGIIPSEKYYAFSDIESVIENFYNVKPKIQCFHPSKNAEVQILGQIEICFHIDLSMLDCEKRSSKNSALLGDQDFSMFADVPSGFSVCDEDRPVYYPPVL
ncbi:ribonuclease T2 [Thalassophryne amazonica]|uniref:ribonuclease T2 n=1 Tax=Thalassophryne amazonica TaxID=390379 RepID=UPI001471FA92|nr:ribonuclease T2 [Thalassophryne amazonica]XP_034044536.1 ribonuclease T2 [Thalassophryne amazonica]XP_034044541.1 ribonuclease T2 [Thalassophryne amazonica]